MMSLALGQDEQRLRLDLKRRLKMAGMESDLAAINDITVLRQLLNQQVRYTDGQPVEVEFNDGWRPGIFSGYADPLPGQDFRRLGVHLESEALSHNFYPERVRPITAPKSGQRHRLLLDPTGFDARQEGLRRGPKGLSPETNRLPGMHRWGAAGEPCLDCRADYWTDKKCPASIGPFTAEPAPGSPEAVKAAAETLDRPCTCGLANVYGRPYNGSHLYGCKAVDWLPREAVAQAADTIRTPEDDALSAHMRAFPEDSSLERMVAFRHGFRASDDLRRKLAADLETSRLLGGRLADALQALYVEAESWPEGKKWDALEAQAERALMEAGRLS